MVTHLWSTAYIRLSLHQTHLLPPSFSFFPTLQKTENYFRQANSSFLLPTACGMVPIPPFQFGAKVLLHLLPNKLPFSCAHMHRYSHSFYPNFVQATICNLPTIQQCSATARSVPLRSRWSSHMRWQCFVQHSTFFSRIANALVTLFERAFLCATLWVLCVLCYSVWVFFRFCKGNVPVPRSVRRSGNRCGTSTSLSSTIYIGLYQHLLFKQDRWLFF